MKIIVTADWHFGYPGRLPDLVVAFRAMINFCLKYEIKIIVLAGDLVHDRESLTHDVSNAISILFEELNTHGIHLIAMIGNHDMFYRHKWNINAIRPFAKQITYIDTVSYFDIDGRRFWVVPFIEHEPFYMKVIKDVDQLASNDDVLITHIGIASAKMNTCFLIQNWSVVSFEDTKFNRIYAGHFHNHQQVGSKSWYTGSPIPFRFDEGLVDHGFIVYDTISNKHTFIDLSKLIPEEVRPPDFITIQSNDVDSIIGSTNNNCVKILLNDGDDQEEIRSKLVGATKIIFVKPKEEKIEFPKKDFSRTNNMFQSWVSYDKPEHLNNELLISLEAEVRSEARYIQDD